MIHVAGPTEVMASERNPTVLERCEGPRYRPAKWVSKVGYGNGCTGSVRADVPDPGHKGQIQPADRLRKSR